MTRSLKLLDNTMLSFEKPVVIRYLDEETNSLQKLTIELQTTRTLPLIYRTTSPHSEPAACVLSLLPVSALEVVSLPFVADWSPDLFAAAPSLAFCSFSFSSSKSC